MRCALYFVPPPDHPLTVAAARWLKRDPYTDTDLPPPPGLDAHDHSALVAAPRRYGFHATLKAPFHLADGYSVHDLAAALARYCRAVPVFALDVEIGLIEGFFAVIPRDRVQALHALEAGLVTAFDRFRAPLSDADLARRAPDRLSVPQRENLRRWGYPHVLEQFRFHMTLTGWVAEAEREGVARLLAGFFGPLTAGALVIDQLAIFVEPEPGAPFVVHSVQRLGLQ